MLPARKTTISTVCDCFDLCSMGIHPSIVLLAKQIIVALLATTFAQTAELLQLC